MITTGIYNNRPFSINIENSFPPVFDKNIACIYGITGLNANVSKDTCLYIGSTNDYTERTVSHFSSLRNKYHYNCHLQSYFSKYGESNLQPLCLEICDEKILLEREQNWIDYYKYNFTHKVLFNMADIAGKPFKSPETIELHRMLMAKDYIITFPDGHEEIHKNLVEFSKKYDLHRASLAKTATGMHKIHRGFMARYVTDEEQRYVDNTWKLKDNINSIVASKEARSKEYLVTFPDGHNEKIKNLKDFCKANGLDYRGPWQVLGGKQDNYKNYKFERISEKSIYPKRLDTNRKIYTVISPDGVITETKSLRKFCQLNGLSYSSMIGVANGRHSHNKSWKVTKSIIS